MRNCMVCKTPCVGEYRRKYNAGNSAYCFMEVLEYKRKIKKEKERTQVFYLKEI